MLSPISANWVGEAFQKLVHSTESGARSPIIVLPGNSRKNFAKRVSTLSRCSAVHCQATQVIRHSVFGKQQGFAKRSLALNFVSKRHLQDPHQVGPPTLIGAGSCVGRRL